MAIDYKLVSADSHLDTPSDLFPKYLARKFHDHPWVRSQIARSKEHYSGLSQMAGRAFEDYTSDELTENEIHKGSYDPDARLVDMDRDGVDAEVLIAQAFGGNVPTGEGVDADLQRAVIRASNDFLSDFCSTRPDRFIGPALIPWVNHDLALEEMRRAARLPGIRAFLFGTSGMPVPLSDPSFEPAWEIASEVGFPINIHLSSGQPSAAIPTGTGSSTGHRVALSPGPDGAAITLIAMGPSSMMYAMAMLIFSGVFQRHPELKMIFTEAGASWRVYLEERMDIAFRRHRHWTESSLTEPPSFYAQRNCVNTFIEDTAAIELRHKIGVENLLWSTDYPHSDSTWPHSWDYVEEGFQGVPDAERHAIIAGNAVSLYRL